jgi:uncharacterized ubiquitin-like protein YukD
MEIFTKGHYIKMENKANDEKIIELKKQVKTRKAKLNKSKRFAPVTNCILDFEMVKYNLQVLTKEQLIKLAVKLNTYVMSEKDLEIEEQKYSGYTLEEWIGDIMSKLDVLSVKDQEKQLKKLEDKLTLLLSNEKKVELEIDEIESLLND